MRRCPPIIEINLEHPLLQRMDSEADEDKFGELAKLVFDQARWRRADSWTIPPVSCTG